MAIPSTVTDLPAGSFYGCINLANLQFNEGLQTIGKSAFEDCSALRSVTFPSTFSKLDEDAFRACENLLEVIFLGGERLINQKFLASGVFSEEKGLLNQEHSTRCYYLTSTEISPFLIVR